MPTPWSTTWGAFIAKVRALPVGEPEYCTTDQGPWIQRSLLFRRRDGSEDLVAAGGCEEVRVDGRVVDGEALTRLYVASLDGQRSGHDYTRAFDDELTCSSAPRGGPVRPGRERLVEAIACDLPPGAESIPSDLRPQELDAPQIALLQRAWTRPGEPVVRDSTGAHPCVDGLPEPPSFLLAATDRSDVVQLVDSPCGYLVWHGTDRSEGATLPVDFRALGLG